MVDGGARKLRIQFNVDSLWTGDKNLTKDIGDDRADANYNTMGAYQNFGELEIELGGLPEGESVGYRRELDIARAVYSDRFQIGELRVIALRARAMSFMARLRRTSRDSRLRFRRLSLSMWTRCLLGSRLRPYSKYIDIV